MVIKDILRKLYTGEVKSIFYAEEQQQKINKIDITTGDFWPIDGELDDMVNFK